MNDERLEELLRARGRALDGGVLGPERAERLRETLRDEVRHEATLARRRRVLRLGVLAAAAVFLFWLFGPLGPYGPWDAGGRAPYGELPLEVALLDPLGRPLERIERGTDPAIFTPPERFVLEVEASADGFLAVALYDALGARRFPDGDRARSLAAGELALFDIPLTNLPTRADGESVVGVLVLSSRRAVPEQELEPLLPANVDLDASGDPGPALDRLAAELASTLGCTVDTRTLTLALR